MCTFWHSRLVRFVAGLRFTGYHYTYHGFTARFPSSRTPAPTTLPPRVTYTCIPLSHLSPVFFLSPRTHTHACYHLPRTRTLCCLLPLSPRHTHTAGSRVGFTHLTLHRWTFTRVVTHHACHAYVAVYRATPLAAPRLVDFLTSLRLLPLHYRYTPSRSPPLHTTPFTHARTRLLHVRFVAYLVHTPPRCYLPATTHACTPHVHYATHPHCAHGLHTTTFVSRARSTDSHHTPHCHNTCVVAGFRFTLRSFPACRLQHTHTVVHRFTHCGCIVYSSATVLFASPRALWILVASFLVLRLLPAWFGCLFGCYLPRLRRWWCLRSLITVPVYDSLFTIPVTVRSPTYIRS